KRHAAFAQFRADIAANRSGCAKDRYLVHDCYNSPKMIQTLFGSVEQEPTLLERLKSGVEKTRAGLVTRLEDMLQGAKQIDADLLDELEFTLIGSDIGVRTTEEILERIRQRVDRKLVGDATEIEGLIREHLLEILQASERPMPRVAEPPAVVLVVGVN